LVVGLGLAPPIVSTQTMVCQILFTWYSSHLQLPTLCSCSSHPNSQAIPAHYTVQVQIELQYETSCASLRLYKTTSNIPSQKKILYKQYDHDCTMNHT
jgi:hypothetical protein